MIPSLTHGLVTEFIVCAQANGRRVQAFAELITLPWAKATSGNCSPRIPLAIEDRFFIHVKPGCEKRTGLNGSYGTDRIALNRCLAYF